MLIKNGRKIEFKFELNSRSLAELLDILNCNFSHFLHSHLSTIFRFYNGAARQE